MSAVIKTTNNVEFSRKKGQSLNALRRSTGTLSAEAGDLVELADLQVNDFHPEPLFGQVLGGDESVARGRVGFRAQQGGVVEGGFRGHVAFVELCAELVRKLVERQVLFPVGVHEVLAWREFQDVLVLDVGDDFEEPREVVLFGESGELVCVVAPDVHDTLHVIVTQQVEEVLRALL